MKVVSLHKNYNSLIKKASKGNKKAQHQLFELFAPKMLSICRQYFKNKNEAEEVMLAGFFKVFNHLNSYKSEGSFEGWIRRIMINEAISQLRKNKRLRFATEEELDNSLNYVTYLESKIEVEEIQKIIDSLPDGYKTVFVLYAIEGYKHSEISEILQISESTSKSQLFKARKMLQNLIENKNNIQYGTH